MIIDKEFKSLIYALGERELEQLETNILAEGIRDPLVVWSGILLDGHNRYAIAQKHGLSFKTVEIELPSRDAAKLWIIKNQLGRRNLTPQQMSYLRGKRYEMEKLSRTEVTSLGGAASGKNCHQLHDPVKTSERIAEESGVSPRTVRGDADFARAVDTIEGIAGEQAKNDLLSGNVRMSKKDIKSVARLASEAPALAVEVVTGKKSVPEAEQEQRRRQSVNVTTFSSESNEYYTPSVYIEAAREVMGGIDLDPASHPLAQETVKAKAFFVESDDGLSREWHGRVWLNPPYGKIGNESGQGTWAQYLKSEHEARRVKEAVLLVKAAVGYEWFEALWDIWPVCFARKRISFTCSSGNSNGQSKQGTAFFYLGDNVEKFTEVFGQFGRVILLEDQRGNM